METVALTWRYVVVVCLTFSLFEHTCAHTSLFLGATFLSYMEKEFYQKIILGINYLSDLSDEEEL